MVDKQQQEHQVQTAVRIPESWLERLDRLAESLSEPGNQITRTGAMRMALHQGIVAMEKVKKQ